MNGLPWSFEEAERRLSQASSRQQQAEDALKAAHKDAAEAEDNYRLQLAKVITSLRDMSIPATVCLDLAKGSEDVAELRRVRDVAEGVKAAAEQACWRRNADRRDAARLADWSCRREFAEAAGEVHHEFSTPIGGRA